MATNKDKIRAAAQKYLQKGQLDKAIREFERLIEDDPNDVRTLLKIGDLQTRKGDQAAATKTYGNVAKYYSDQGFFLKAVAVYKQILKLDPALADINLRLAELYHQLGLVSDAVAQYRAICEIYEKAERWDDSLAVLNKMVDLDVGNVAARIKLAELHARLGRLDEAKAEFSKAASTLKNDKRIDDYIKVAERMVHIDPADVATARDLAAIYVQKGDARRALAKLQVCFRTNPKDPETLTLLAQAFADLGQAQKAASVLRELAEVQAANPAARQVTLRKIALLEPSAESVAEAPHAQAAPAQTGPAHDDFRGGTDSPLISHVEELPDALDVDVPEADIEDAQLAEEEPGDMVALPESNAPEDVNKMLVEADIYIKYGLRNKAIEHLEKVLTEQPKHRGAQQRFKNVLLDADDTSAALDVLWSMAENALELGETQQARDDLEEMLTHHPGHMAARQKLRELAPAAAAPQQMPASQAPADDDSAGISIDLDDMQNFAVDDAEALSIEVESEPFPESEIAVDFDTSDFDTEALPPAAAAHPESLAIEIDEDSFTDGRTTAQVLPSAAQMAAARPMGVQLQATPPSDTWGTPAAAEDRDLDAILAGAVPAKKVAAPRPTAATAPVPASRAAAAPAAAPAEEEDLDLSSELDEIGFFLQQGLTDEAHEALQALIMFYPDHPGVRAMQTQVQGHAAEPAGSAQALRQVAADLQEEIVGVEVDDDNFQMSFEDVFDQFKKGVEKQVDSEDYETHYNLGIAYKEMGLLDDAIREFERSARAANLEINALMMMGLCELERGNTDEALKHFMRGLGSPRSSPREQVALRYEVALAYESMGRFADAVKFYEKACAMDPTFRDVANRLHEAQKHLSDGPAASSDDLDALLGEAPPGRKSNKISYL